MTNNTIAMTSRSLTRFEVLTRLSDGSINGSEAALQLSLSVRQVKRLKAALAVRGAEALVHGNTLRRSNRALDPKLAARAVSLIAKHYPDFKPTLASEKLAERHGIALSVETVRSLMTDAGLWKPRRRKKSAQHRTWRPRKDRYGEMEQFDGSYHRWFEERAPESCLLAAIDDATGRITKAVFAEHEGVVPVFRFWDGYVREQGVPKSVYLDKYGTYKINHPSAVDNSDLLTQFERAAREIGMKLIVAHSPQAKGRIERLFETLQDRLVKELRLAGISDIETANRFLAETFIPWFNERFAVAPSKRGDAHRPLNIRERDRLPAVFSVQSVRQVQNDFTIRFKNRWLQLGERQAVTVCRKDAVVLEERLDGSLYLRHARRSGYLAYEVLPERPERALKAPVVLPATVRLPWKPPKDHPWRTPVLKKRSARRVETRQRLSV